MASQKAPSPLFSPRERGSKSFYSAIISRLLPYCLLAFSLQVFFPANVEALEVAAKAAVLMEAGSGNIMWEKNQTLKLPPASTAKVLSALVVLERNRLDEIVAVPAIATKTSGATIPLAAGERFTVEALLFAMLLGSANDAALALAIHSGGSVDKFVALMNQTAHRVGARGSKFLNPTGLQHAGQLSTAFDLSLITRVALESSDFQRIVGTKRYSWKSARRQGELKNSNRLLDDYPGAIGVKTGNTREAGYCLIAAAARQNRTLIAVILNSQERSVWEDARALLDYGFTVSARK